MVDQRLKELRGPGRREFLKWSATVAACLGIERSRFLNVVGETAGTAAADSASCANTNLAFNIAAGNGGLANFTQVFPFTKVIASTSAMAKMFDIFTMASYDPVAAMWAAPACPGVKVLGTDGKFTKDGLTCLMGKPARDEHVAIANDAIAKNATDGAKLAIAALLSAAHTCQ